MNDDPGDLSLSTSDPGPVPADLLAAADWCVSAPFVATQGRSRRKPWRTAWPEEFPVDIRPIDYNGHVPEEAA